MRKDTFYFTHDFNAQGDPKHEKLIFEMGWEGYGLFWAIIEKLSQETNGWKLEKEYDRIGYVLRATKDSIKKIIEDYDLFKTDEKYFWSERLLKHFKERKLKSDKAKKSIKARWDKVSTIDTNVLQSNTERNTRKERKGKETKVKESKIKEIDKIPPQKNLVEEYFIEKESDKEEANKFFNYYESNGWKVGKNKMKKWKSAASGWMSRSYQNVSETGVQATQTQNRTKGISEGQKLYRDEKKAELMMRIKDMERAWREDNKTEDWIIDMRTKLFGDEIKKFIN